VRRAIMSGEFAIKGDAAKSVTAMIATLDQPAMPLRLALGSTAYDNIEAALERRLAELRAQKAAAYGADV
jgi:hypothetical protein